MVDMVFCSMEGVESFSPLEGFPIEGKSSGFCGVSNMNLFVVYAIVCKC